MQKRKGAVAKRWSSASVLTCGLWTPESQGRVLGMQGLCAIFLKHAAGENLVSQCSQLLILSFENCTKEIFLFGEPSLKTIYTIDTFKMVTISMPNTTWFGREVLVFSAQMDDPRSWHCLSLCYFMKERCSTCQVFYMGLCWCQQPFQQSQKRSFYCCESLHLPQSQELISVPLQ